MQILFLSCKKASGLIEKKLHFSLSPVEKIQLLIHAGLCEACRSYNKQSRDLDSLLARHILHKSQPPDAPLEPLPDNTKQNILSQLAENE